MMRRRLPRFLTKKAETHDRKNVVLRLRPGERVAVRNAEEILQTLDKNDMLEGLPFTSEMRGYCGGKFTVLRRVDKILVEGDGMRSMKNTVILKDVICDGKAHNGCKRTCLLFWKEAWLKRI